MGGGAHNLPATQGGGWEDPEGQLHLDSTHVLSGQVGTPCPTSQVGWDSRKQARWKFGGRGTQSKARSLSYERTVNPPARVTTSLVPGVLEGSPGAVCWRLAGGYQPTSLPSSL